MVRLGDGFKKTKKPRENLRGDLDVDVGDSQSKCEQATFTDCDGNAR